MRNIRIIPRLDIKGPNLVKGIHLEGLRVLGKPEDFARFYYQNGADELMFMDVVASLYGRNSLEDIISKTAKEIFIPLTVGGGIRTLADIKRVLRAGADKVSINTAAIRRPDFITEASEEFGSSTILITIEAIKEANGQYLAYIDNGREHTGIEVVEWAQKVQDLGAGEVVLTSVDREGTGEGFDLDLIEGVADKLSIPLIVHGGPGDLTQIESVLNYSVDAFSIASLFHYKIFEDLENSNDQEIEGNREFLKSGRTFSKIKPVHIVEVKNYIFERGFDCRTLETPLI